MKFSNFVSIKNQHLTEYHYSSGGGMTGGYFSETVEKYDDDFALITTEKAEWHSDEPALKKYLVDARILSDLESVVRKNHMNFWHRKTFTNMFVADGESYSYSFQFSENSIDFSSQIYPAKYREKLKKLDEIIKNYLKNSKELSE